MKTCCGLKDLTLLHRCRLRGYDHPKVINQLNLLVACVQKLVWAKVWLFLGSNKASFLSVYEGQPDKAWQHHLVCVSLEIAKFFKLPCGKSLYPIKIDLLKSKVEGLMRPLCDFLKEVYAEDCKLFFSCSKDIPCTELIGHSGTHA